MIDVISFLPAKRKQTSSGWISVNAPCCVHRGESADRRQRGGIKVQPDGAWSWHCFNCGYTASFVLGRTLTFKARKLLQWLNVPTEEIERMNLESLKQKNILGILNDRQQVAEKLPGIEFEERDLPADTQPLNNQSTDYLKNRCIPIDYPFLYKTMPRPGVVIPFTHNNQVVGHTTRFLDDRTPRYINDIQPGYVFGTDLQQSAWQYAIVVEGVFDAISARFNPIPLFGKIVQPLLKEKILIRKPPKVIVALDSDAIKDSIKICEWLISNGIKTSMVKLPDKDINEFGFQRFSEYIEILPSVDGFDLMKERILV